MKALIFLNPTLVLMAFLLGVTDEMFWPVSKNFWMTPEEATCIALPLAVLAVLASFVGLLASAYIRRGDDS